MPKDIMLASDRRTLVYSIGAAPAYSSYLLNRIDFDLLRE